eukprot:TRINITY_DN1647_c0_g1_i2.p1 TRINITY_DN1647_c0_g1~~TRINITY_DN1647_c0_g1_i2.p1  ORF type:complete len:202 (-),score=23.79 TRINITY_DN1647_c0_g1_i2:459-1064(-)
MYVRSHFFTSPRHLLWYCPIGLCSLRLTCIFITLPLTSPILPAAEKAAREQKVQAEIRQTARENNFYLAKVEQAKTMENIKSRKAKGSSAEGERTGLDKADKRTRAGTSLDEDVKRTFRQRKDATEFAAVTEKRERDDVLTKLFTNKGRGRVGHQGKTTSDRRPNVSDRLNSGLGSAAKRDATDLGGMSIFSRQAKKTKVT